MNEFNGFEVTSNGNTIYWGTDRRAAVDAYEKSRSSVKMYEHKGQFKTLVSMRTAKYHETMKDAFKN